jgi:hypothetical protein
MLRHLKPSLLVMPLLLIGLAISANPAKAVATPTPFALADFAFKTLDIKQDGNFLYPVIVVKNQGDDYCVASNTVDRDIPVLKVEIKDLTFGSSLTYTGKPKYIGNCYYNTTKPTSNYPWEYYMYFDPIPVSATATSRGGIDFSITIDPEHQFLESDTSNNSTTTVVLLNQPSLKPDFIVKEVGVKDFTGGNPGNYYYAIVKNVSDEYIFSSNGHLGIIFDGSTGWRGSIDSSGYYIQKDFAKGETITLNQEIVFIGPSVNQALPGEYSITATVNPANPVRNIAEDSYDNNAMSAKVKVGYKPDLVIDSVKYTARQIENGGKKFTAVSFEITYQNIGKAAISKPFYITAKSGATDDYLDEPGYVAGIMVDASENSKIEIGKKYTAYVGDYILTSGKSLYKDFSFFIDRYWPFGDVKDNLISEENENNNTKNIKVEVDGPDFVVSKIELFRNSSPVLGKTSYSAYLTIENSGAAANGANKKLDIKLTDTAGNKIYKTYLVAKSFPHDYKKRIYIGLISLSDSTTLDAEVDYLKQFSEINENNNVISRKAVVTKADLSISGVAFVKKTPTGQASSYWLRVSLAGGEKLEKPADLTVCAMLDNRSYDKKNGKVFGPCWGIKSSATYIDFSMPSYFVIGKYKVYAKIDVNSGTDLIAEYSGSKDTGYFLETNENNNSVYKIIGPSYILAKAPVNKAKNTTAVLGKKIKK